MRFLFELDAKDYDKDAKVRLRPSVRAIVIRDGKVAMVRSQNKGYYKFPGGGIEPGESQVQTLVRETAEEAGLVVLPETAREFGQARKICKAKNGLKFIQENYYYTCQVSDQQVSQHLDPKEQESQLVPEFVEPSKAIEINRSLKHLPNSISLEREARILELAIEEFGL